MVMRRLCAFRHPSGEPCRAAPLHDSEFCLMHSPEHAPAVQEARRLGGQHRKRVITISIAYDFEGLDTISGIRHILDIATLDALAAENNLPRSRTLAYLMQVALKAMEVGDVEKRLADLEQAVHSKQTEHVPPIFDVETELLQGGNKETK